MDFLNPTKKRANTIRLFIGYGLMAIALGFGTLILVFQANGYDVNRQDGSVIQNGLIFMDSQPVSGTIFVNGQSKGQTSTRLVLPEGQYKIELKRDGYRPWQHDVALEGSTIERLVYSFLFPSKLRPKDVQLYANPPTMASQSPDRRWLIVQAGQLEKFEVVDLSNNTTPTTTIAVPANLFTAKAGNHSLEAVEWSTDNRHVLLKHAFEGGHEFVMLDREQPTLSANINRVFNIALTEVVLRDKKFDQLYLFDAASGALRSGNSRTREVIPIAEKVLAFRSHGESRLLYTTEESATAGNVWARLKEGNNTFNLRQIAKSPKYLLDLAQYDSRWYVAFGSITDQKLYIYRDPVSTAQRDKSKLPPAYRVLRLLDANPEYISFSANARFIALQGGSKFAVYDAETNRQFRYDIQANLPPGYKATWMDGHRLLALKEGKALVFEFDGQNRQTLIDINAAYPPFFDRNYDAVYAIGPSPAVANKQSLNRSDLIVTR